MLTVFSIPGAFAGRAGELQRNAVRSWLRIGARVQVVLVGDEPGVAEISRELGLVQLPEIERSERGSPLLDDVFARVDEAAAYTLRAFVDPRLVLLDGFERAVTRVAYTYSRFLAVGRSVAVETTGEIDFSPGWELILRAQAGRRGKPCPPSVLDYFVFPAGLYRSLPPFAAGHAHVGGWLVWEARRDARVVDLSGSVLALHQSSPGAEKAPDAEEDARNLALAGGKRHRGTLDDANLMLARRGVRRRSRLLSRVGELSARATSALGSVRKREEG
jgi:hypothetical protein